MTYDLVIVGGGPAGLATAIFAAQSGLPVVVFESRTLPLDKACGEGIMPPGVSLLREMGVNLDEGDFVPFVGIRYTDRTVQAEGRFPGSPGWGVRRIKLVERMIERARALHVELHFGTKVKAWGIEEGGTVHVEMDDRIFRAKLLVGADGLHSRIRAGMGVERPARGPKRYGVRRHFAIEPWSSFVEVYWSEKAEAYVTPVGPKEVGVAVLWSCEAGQFEKLLGRFPTLEERLAGAAFTSHARGAGPFRQVVERRCVGPLALVGDAAGYVDALTGEGLSLSFHCARALVDTFLRNPDLSAYEREYRRLSRSYYWMTNLLLFVAERPRLRRRVIATLARYPELFDRFLAVSTGDQPLYTLGLGGALKMLLGISVSAEID